MAHTKKQIYFHLESLENRTQGLHDFVHAVDYWLRITIDNFVRYTFFQAGETLLIIALFLSVNDETIDKET